MPPLTNMAENDGRPKLTDNCSGKCDGCALRPFKLLFGHCPENDCGFTAIFVKSFHGKPPRGLFTATTVKYLLPASEKHGFSAIRL
ncbi:hypothetical protein Pla52n_16510 [Stieleria varia]|uniref:Uncharacterized protein n=1 Tax=Stieleria varia TaxID=2528005 RepID=A0A5C6B0V5_9BACT|nr:hypothetical protein Pla52n_16510 [Stieleria varia]